MKYTHLWVGIPFLEIIHLIKFKNLKNEKNHSYWFIGFFCITSWL